MNPSPAISTSKMYIICIENFFCFYFTFEVLVRLLSFKVSFFSLGRKFWVGMLCKLSGIVEAFEGELLEDETC
jgi:hypothetical protein